MTYCYVYTVAISLFYFLFFVAPTISPLKFYVFVYRYGDKWISSRTPFLLGMRNIEWFLNTYIAVSRTSDTWRITITKRFTKEWLTGTTNLICRGDLSENKLYPMLKMDSSRMTPRVWHPTNGLLSSRATRIYITSPQFFCQK